MSENTKLDTSKIKSISTYGCAMRVIRDAEGGLDLEFYAVPCDLADVRAPAKQRRRALLDAVNISRMQACLGRWIYGLYYRCDTVDCEHSCCHYVTTDDSGHQVHHCSCVDPERCEELQNPDEDAQ